MPGKLDLDMTNPRRPVISLIALKVNMHIYNMIIHWAMMMTMMKTMMATVVEEVVAVLTMMMTMTTMMVTTAMIKIGTYQSEGLKRGLSM